MAEKILFRALLNEYYKTIPIQKKPYHSLAHSSIFYEEEYAGTDPKLAQEFMNQVVERIVQQFEDRDRPWLFIYHNIIYLVEITVFIKNKHPELEIGIHITSSEWVELTNGMSWIYEYMNNYQINESIKVFDEFRNILIPNAPE